MKNGLRLSSEGLTVLFEGPFILPQMITSNSFITNGSDALWDQFSLISTLA